MPPKGYRSITVREETYSALKEAAARRGLTLSRLLDEFARGLCGGSGAAAGGGEAGAAMLGVEERVRRLEDEVARLRKALYDVVVTLDIMRREASRERPGEE